MKSIAVAVATTAGLALAACDPSSAVPGDSNLSCAALISASTFLVASGRTERDPKLAKRASVSSMTYLNAYAIPKRMKEAEAFAEVKSLRERLLESEQPADIMRRARRCDDRSPV